MGLLDDTLASSNINTNLDNLTFNTAKALENVASKAAALRPTKSYGPTFKVDQQTGWADESIGAHQEQTDYLSNQIKANDERTARFADSFVSDENLASSNPLIAIPANIANMGAKVGSSIGRTATGLFTGVLDSAIANENQRIPKDIFDLGERQRLSGSAEEIKKELQGLDNQLKYGGLSNDDRDRVLVDRANKLNELRLANTPLTPEETKRLTQASDEAFKATGEKNWQAFFDARNGAKNVSEIAKGDPSKGKSSFIGSENLGNDFQQRTYQAIKENNGLKNSGFIDQVLGTMGDVVTSPGIVADSIADSAIYMNPFTRPLAVAGTFGESTSKGLDRLSAGGNQVSDNEQMLVTGVAAGAATFDHLGGKVLEKAGLGQLGGKLASGSGSVAKSVTSRVNEASAATIGKLGVAGKLAHASGAGLNIAGAAATPLVTRIGAAGLAEGLTEVGQNTFEQVNDTMYRKDNGNLGVNFSTSDFADSFTLGAASGGYVATPAAVVKTGVDAFAQGVQANNEKRFGNAETTGEELLDGQSPKYSPMQAVERSVAPTFGLSPDDAEYSSKMATAKEGADNAMKVATANVANTQSIVDRLDKIDTMRENVGKLEALLQSVEANTELDPEVKQNQIEAITGKLNLGKQKVAEVEKALENREAFEKVHKNNQDKLAEAENIYSKFMGIYSKNMGNSTTTDPNATPTQNEAGKLLGAPSFGNVQRMRELSENQELDEMVRANLRIVSDALVAENKAKSLGEVSKNVLNGTKGYRGMDQYIKQMQAAVDNGDTVQQEVLTRQLSNFKNNVTSKYEAAVKAMEIANQRYNDDPLGRPRDFSVDIVRDKATGIWSVKEEGRLSKFKLDKNNGLTIHSQRGKETGGSMSLINALQANMESAIATEQALNGLRNSNPNAQVQPEIDFSDPSGFEQAMEAMVNEERMNGRDTTARDSDPNAQVVDNQLGMTEPTVITDTDVNNVDALADTAYAKASDIRQQEYDDLVAEAQNADNTTGVGSDIVEANKTATTEKETTEKAEEVDAMTKAEAESAAKAASKATGKKFKAKAVVGGYDIEEVKTTEPKKETKPKAEVKADKPKPKVDKESNPSNEVYEDADTESTDIKSKELKSGKVDSSPKGAITALDTNGLSYKEAIESDTSGNLIKKSFVQRLRDGINSPLVNTKDLVTTLLKNKGVDNMISKFIAKNSVIDNPTEAQVNLVQNFLNFAYSLRTPINSTIREKANKDYFHESIIDFIMVDGPNGEKQLDENVATAIALGGYDWLATNGSQLVATKQDIANKIWMPEAKVLPDDAYALLSLVGTYRNEVIKSMGQKALASLQLKQLSKADKDITNKLTMALGAIAFQSLENTGLVQSTDVSVKRLNELKAEIKELNPDENFSGDGDQLKANTHQAMTFIRPAVNMSGANVDLSAGFPTAVGKIASIVNVHKNASTVLPSIFGFTSDTNMPSSEPIKEVVRSFDDIGSNITKLQSEVLTKSQSRPYSIDNSMVGILQAFDKSPKLQQLIQTMFGYKDPNSVLAVRSENVRSQNEEITRSLNTLGMTYNEFGGNDMYLQNSVWSNMRSGITSVFNPQANRIHRAFSSLNSDIISVPHAETEVYKDGELTKYGMFLRGLGYRMEDAEGMTVQGELAKNYMQDWLPAFDQYVKSEEVQTAVEALNKVKDGSAENKDFKTVSDLITKWSNGADGLSVLNALSEQNLGRKAGKDFTTRIPVESDGSNNGPAFTQVMMNTGNTNIYNSVGVYFNDQSIQTETGQTKPMIDMVTYRKGKGKDMYEQLAQFKQDLMEVAVSEGNKVLDSINILDTDFTGRKGAKRDLVPFNYGAGMDAVKRAASKAFYESILDKYEKAILTKDIVSINDLSNQVNTLVKAYNQMNGTKVALVNPRTMTTLNATLAPQEKAIRGIEQSMRGDITEQALTEFLGDYIRSRNEITSIANTAFNLFEPLYKATMASALNEYYKENPEAARTKSNLTKEQYEKMLKGLRKYMPKVDVAMGIHNKQFGMTAIPLMSTEKVWSTTQLAIPFNRSQYSQPTEIKYGTNAPKFKAVKDQGNLTVGVETTVVVAPGASALAKFIQSHDAYVNFRVMDKYSVQNYHDASPVNPYQANEVAQYQNEAFLDAVTTSHIGEAFINSILAPLEAYSDGMVPATKENISRFNKQLRSLQDKFLGKDSEFSNADTIKHIANKLLSEDLRKMDNLINNGSAINQYATEGGHFEITPTVRATLLKRKSALEQRINKNILPRIDEIFSKLDQPSAPRTQATLTERQYREEVNTASKEGENVKTPFERNLLSNRDKLSDPKELVKHVRKELAQFVQRDDNVGSFAKIYDQLLNLGKSNLEGVKVNVFYDTEINESNKPLGYDEADSNLHAWYKAENGKREINIRLGTTNKVDAKVITHELIHAATADAIYQIGKERKSKNPKSVYSVTANNAYDNLVSNYNDVKAYVDSNINLTENPLIKYGVTNLDEFVATALTYSEFGNFLNNMKVNKAPNRRAKPTKGSMLRNVMENLVGLFKGVYGGGQPNAKEVSALEALTIDVTTFIEQTTNAGNTDGGSLLGAPSSNISDVNKMSAMEVLNALPSTGSIELDGRLNTIIDSVTEKVLSKLPKDYKGKGHFSPENIWNNALETNEIPYQSEAVRMGFRLTDREQFALESTELALSELTKDRSISEVYADIERIYDTAREHVKVSDMHNGEWANATSEEKEVAQAKHDYLFGSGKHGLNRYVAMALTTNEVGRINSFNMDGSRRKTSDNEYFEKMFKFVDKKLDTLLDNSIGTKSRDANTRLNALVKKFVDIDNKQRNKVLNTIEQASEFVDTYSNKGVKAVANKVADLASATSPEMQSAKIIRNVTISTLTGKPFALVDLMNDFRNRSNKNQTLGFAGELGKELGNATSQQRTAEKLVMAQKQHENEAQRLRTSLKKDLLSTFKDDGVNLTKEVREAVTKVMLRTDMQSLTYSYSMDQLKDLMSDRTKLNAAIKHKKQGISSLHNLRAKILAWYMVSNKGNKLLAKSPLAIASNVGMNVRNPTPDTDYVNQLDELVSLYALRYTDRNMVDEAIKVMDSEKTKDGYGGIENVLKYHKSLANDSKSALFSGTELNYVKGYLPELTNTSKRVEVAETQADVDRLRQAMYTELGPVKKDSADPSTFTPIMFYTEDANTQQYLSGAMPLFAYGSKGSKLGLGTDQIQDIMNDLTSLNIDEDFDPRTVEDNSMIPLYDGQGNIVDMRYEMSGFRRDTLLERNHDFSDVLGSFNAIGYTKVANVHQYENVVDALYEDHRKASTADANKYVYVSYESTDPVAYAAWNRLSNETKEYVNKVWGGYGMWVSNDAFLTVFGYPKISLATAAFDKDQSMRNFAEELYVTVMKTVFRGNARIVGAKGEKIWQEAVALSKNFIVIRNLSTMLMNISSNSFLLMAHGVSIADIIRDTRESIRGGMQYRKDVAMLTKLEARQRAGIGDANVNQREIDKLKARMDNNPMQEFINKGMFAGIVEDIDPSQDMYSYQSGAQRKLNDMYNKVPKPVRTVAEYAFVTPSTPLYQFLHSATQYSDFAAKYTLYKHLKDKKGKDDDYALFEAQDNFINYDVPTSPWMQYMNDMGLLMFTKYNIRIQKALFKLIAERPASAIGQAIMMQGTTTLPYGIDPIVFNQYGNPFREGAFGIFGTIDEPFPIKALF